MNVRLRMCFVLSAYEVAVGAVTGDSLVFSLSSCQVAVIIIFTVFIELIFTWSIKN